MIGNDIIDFFMEELVKPNASPNRIRQSVKHLTSMSPGASQGRRMLMEQLVDVLFDLYVTGLADAVELGCGQAGERVLDGGFAVGAAQGGGVGDGHRDAPGSVMRVVAGGEGKGRMVNRRWRP